MAKRPNKSEGVFRDVLRQRNDPSLGYLGDPEFVGQLLKDQVQHFLRRAESFAHQETTLEVINKADLDDCNKLARIFGGLNSCYTPVGHWNKGGGLAAALRQALKLPPAAQSDDLAAIFYSLEVFRNEIYKALIPAMRGEIDGDEAGKVVEDTMHRYAKLFSGLPT